VEDGGGGQRRGNAQIPIRRHIKKQRSVDPSLYRQRNLIVRLFNKLKHFRRIAPRFDKLAGNFPAAFMLAAIRLWLRAYEPTT
jgi:transposase